MCVGVFLLIHYLRRRSRSLPHVRGGVSWILTGRGDVFLSSPCAWGCFFDSSTETYFSLVFPMCVGVFLFDLPFVQPSTGLPHVRGGVSGVGQMIGGGVGSSPCAWGCFLYERDARGGTRCLPHVRGGVSTIRRSTHPRRRSSPCAWGCFSV